MLDIYILTFLIEILFFVLLEYNKNNSENVVFIFNIKKEKRKNKLL